MSRAVRALGVLSIPVLTVPFVGSGADAATLPKPPSKALPSALDLASPYQAQRLCDPVAKPGVLAFAKLFSSHYGLGSASYGIIRNCNSGVTEHSEGRAWDWMLSVDKPNEKAVADSVTAWLSAPDSQGRPGAMARRFGIMYIIWNKKMWRAYDPGRGWAPYTGSAPHTDHIHFSFSWDGAYGHTSWWTGKAITSIDPGPGAAPQPSTPTPTPTPTSYPVLARGSSGPDVALAQKVVGATPDGQFGPRTELAVRAWQGRNGVPVTGVLDARTWARMVALKLVPARGAAPTTPAPKPAPAPTPAPTPSTTNPLAPYAATTIRTGATGPAVVALQKALGVTADGQFGPRTEAAVKAFQTRRNLTANGVVGPPTWQALMGGAAATAAPSRSAPVRTATPYTALMSTVLRNGSRGEAVKVLQRALGGLAVDGGYGARTVAAVTAFQKAHRLPATGVTDTKVWTALEQRDYPLRGYYATVLRKGSKGAAVVALQKALRVGADGQFGAVTEAAVKSLQGRARLARTGVVATVTWKAVEAELRKR